MYFCKEESVMADSIDIYMNRPQRMNHIIGAHDVRGVASRRVGKTESIGDRVFQVGKSMPQGMGAWGGISHGYPSPLPT